MTIEIVLIVITSINHLLEITIRPSLIFFNLWILDINNKKCSSYIVYVKNLITPGLENSES